MIRTRSANSVLIVLAMHAIAVSAYAQGSANKAASNATTSGPHGSLGVAVLTAPAGGVMILDVAPGGNAERAGVQSRDIISAIDSTPIRNFQDFAIKVVGTPPGTVVRLSVVRGGVPREIKVTVESDSNARVVAIAPPTGAAPARPAATPADHRAGENFPERAIPAGFSLLPDPQGSGRVLLGSFTGNARSATAIAQGALAGLRGYFDSAPAIHTAARNDSDRQVQALFSAAIQNVPVVGVIGVNLSSNGSGTIAVLFDRAGSFRDSYTRLRGRATPLHPVSLADGSVISIPEGWRIVSSAKGAVDVAGPSGEALALGDATPVHVRVPNYPGVANQVLSGPCCDPVKAMTTLTPQLSAVMQRAGMPAVQLARIEDVQSTPAPLNGQAAFIFANLNIGGRPTRSFSWVAAVPAGFEQWVYYISSVSAPSELFANEASTLLAIWKSYSINPQVFAERMDDAVKNMKKATESILSAGRESARVREAAAEGWDRVIRGVDTIENTRTGRRYDVDNQSAQRLVDGLNGTGSGRWKVVAMDELVPKQ